MAARRSAVAPATPVDALKEMLAELTRKFDALARAHDDMREAAAGGVTPAMIAGYEELAAITAATTKQHEATVAAIDVATAAHCMDAVVECWTASLRIRDAHDRFIRTFSAP